jgi:DUF1680 family protein
MLKLTRHLYAWNPAPHYFDYYERSLLNHRIGTIRPKLGYTQYYLSLAPGAWKTFGSEDQSFWCCTGSGIEEYSKLSDSIYWHDSQGVYVNLFIPSELNWEEKGFGLRQQTNFPESETVLLRVTSAGSEDIPIRLRIPGWLQSSPTVRVNGVRLEVSACPNSYLTLMRPWKAGDTIELELPMHLRVESMPDDPAMQAFLYGPVVLAGDLGNSGFSESDVIGPNLRVGAPHAIQHGSPLGNPRITPQPDISVGTFRSKGDDLSIWIKPADKPLTFRTTHQQTDVVLTPLNSLFDKRYSVYWRVS